MRVAGIFSPEGSGICTSVDSRKVARGVVQLRAKRSAERSPDAMWRNLPRTSGGVASSSYPSP